MPRTHHKVEEVRAVFLNEKYRKDDFFIGIFAVSSSTPDSADGINGARLTVLGTAAPGELTTQLEYRLYGHREKNEKFGEQFRMQTFVVAKPHSRVGVIKYLCKAGQGHGLGQATATALWNKFGPDAVRILRESPEVAVAAAGARGFSIEKAQVVATQLAEWSAIEDCSIELIDVLDGRGLPKDTARKAVQVWGNRAAAIIQKDPYKLMRFRGCGFLKTDAMYLDLGLPAGRLKRQAYAATYEVASDSNGHVWYPVEKAIRGVKAKVSGQECEPEKALTLARRGKILVERVDERGQRWVADARDANNEEFIAQHVAEAMGERAAWPNVSELGGDLTDHQRTELAKSLRGVIGLFCGAAGTGKTWSAAPLIRAIISEHGIDEVACCCPTGKAAIRLTESLLRHRITIRATTIHRMLAVETAPEEGDSGGGWGFKYNQHNPLPFKFIIADEMSMTDASLMRALLAARAKGTHVLFIGDPNQLPPVGRGAPLRDFIAAGLAYGELREIHRNAGTIVRAGAAIRDNTAIPIDTVLAPHDTPPRNLKLIPAVQGNAASVVMDLVRRIRDMRIIDAVWDLQVLVAVNKRSPLSRVRLNALLQAEMNPSGEQVPGSPFRVNDKVIVTKNSTLPNVMDKGESFCANGEFGRVLEVHPKKTIVKFENPERTVLIPRGNGGSDAKSKDGDDEKDEKKESDGSGCDLALGYACSCHKLQGSSAKIVIVCLDEYPGATGPFGVCDRGWAYTAITRAEEICFLVGKRVTLDRMRQKVAIHSRKTFLVEQIREWCQQFGTAAPNAPPPTEPPAAPTKQQSEAHKTTEVLADLFA